MSKSREADGVQLSSLCPCCGNLKLYLLKDGQPFAVADMPRETFVALAMDLIAEGKIEVQDFDRASERVFAAMPVEGNA